MPIGVKLELDDSFIEKSVGEVLASRNMANNPIEISAGQIRDIYRGLKG